MAGRVPEEELVQCLAQGRHGVDDGGPVLAQPGDEVGARLELDRGQQIAARLLPDRAVRIVDERLNGLAGLERLGIIQHG